MVKEDEVLIGWASEDITPERPVMLHGQFHVRISQRVNDPLTVTALAIESKGGEQAVMVSCDLVYVQEVIVEQCRNRIKSKLPGLDTQKIFFNATHIHTGPTLVEGLYPKQTPEVMTPTESADFFVKRATDCILQAWKNRKPGGLSWGSGQAVVGHNRRMTYFDGKAKMYGNTDDVNFSHIEGYEDHSVNLLFTWDMNRKLTGIVVNLACPSQVTESEYYVSADFWHEIRTEIRKRYSADLFILPQCSPAGDQSPHLLVHKKSEARMRELKGISEREEIADRVANAVDEVLPVVKDDIHTKLIFRHIVKTINLPVRMVTDEELRNAKEEYARIEKSDEMEASRQFIFLRRNEAIIERYKQQKKKPYFPMELHVIHLGDIAIATNRFELFLDFGLRIKARSDALQTFLVQLTGEGTYLPTERAVAAKSYGGNVIDNLVGPKGGQELVERTIEEINRIWEK